MSPLDIEAFSAHHPMGYVLMTYSVVWLLLFGYALWIAFQWRRSRLQKKATEPGD